MAWRGVLSARYNSLCLAWFVSTGELEGITARQGNRLCDYPQGKPVSTSRAGGQTFFLRTVFRKRRVEDRFARLKSHFYFNPNQNTPCSQGVFWFGYCTNWGIGRPARPRSRGCPGSRYCTNWGIGRPARLYEMLVAVNVDCTNWGIGRPARQVVVVQKSAVDCTNWGIGRPARPISCSGDVTGILYQLGNWKAGRTESRQGSSGFPVAPAAESDNPPCAQKRLPLEGEIERRLQSLSQRSNSPSTGRQD